jgi:hypothetical protein
MDITKEYGGHGVHDNVGCRCPHPPRPPERRKRDPGTRRRAMSGIDSRHVTISWTSTHGNKGTPPWAGHFLRDSYQTPANSKKTHRGDPGHLSPTPRPTPNLEGHLERAMGAVMVGVNGSAQIRRGIVEGGTHNSESLPRRDGNLGPPDHVHNRTRNPETHSQNTVHIRTTKNSENDHRTIPETSRLGEPTSQERIPTEQPILGFFPRNRVMAREPTIRAHPLQRHGKTDTKPHSRAR